jgi:hypothetical protein
VARAKRLWKLKADETSGVDHPAHGHEGWIVRKSADDIDAEIRDVLDQLKDKEEPVGDQLKELLTKAKETLPAESHAQVDALLASLDGGDALTKAQADLTAEQVARKAAEEKAQRAEAALKALAGDKPDAEADEIAKAMADLPEPVRKAFDAQQARLVKAEADTADALKKANDERDARLSREYLEKAREYTGLAAPPETVATLLRKAEQGEALEKADSDELTRILKAAANAAKNPNAFKELGGPGADVAGDDQSKAEALANELQKADPDLPRATALVKAYDQLERG